MRRRLAYIGLLSVLTIFLTKTAYAADKFPFLGIAKADSVNVRAGNNLNFEILYKLEEGELITVVGESYNWYKVNLPRGARCYVACELVETEDNRVGIIKKDNVNVRARPGLNYSIIGQLNRKDTVKILDRHNGWFEIEPPEGCFGWIDSNLIGYQSEVAEVPVRERAEQKQINKVKQEVKPEERIAIAKEEAKHEPSEVKLTPPLAVGRIEDLGKILNRPGTHKLVRDGQIIYYLRGKREELDSLIYQVVKIWGEAYHNPRWRCPIIEVERVEPAI